MIFPVLNLLLLKVLLPFLVFLLPLLTLSLMLPPLVFLRIDRLVSYSAQLILRLLLIVVRFLMLMNIMLFLTSCVNLLSIFVMVLIFSVRKTIMIWIILSGLFMIILILVKVDPASFKITQPHYLLDVMGLSDTTRVKIKGVGTHVFIFM